MRISVLYPPPVDRINSSLDGDGWAMDMDDEHGKLAARTLKLAC
jgi:hypothetical protein